MIAVLTLVSSVMCLLLGSWWFWHLWRYLRAVHEAFNCLIYEDPRGARRILAKAIGTRRIWGDLMELERIEEEIAGMTE